MAKSNDQTIKKEVVKVVLDLLEVMYPDAGCALEHENIFQLLIATVLSAQTTDKSVNLVTGGLFDKYPDAFHLAKAAQSDVEKIIRTIGMFKTKSRNIINLSVILVNEYDGKVPRDFNALTSLPGVGRKTANVVMSVGFGEQRIAVDTHVFRVANRIGLAIGKDVLETEEGLMKNIPENRWTRTHHSLIFHGRNLCTARNPKCLDCMIRSECRYFKEQKESMDENHGI